MFFSIMKEQLWASLGHFRRDSCLAILKKRERERETEKRRAESVSLCKWEKHCCSLLTLYKKRKRYFVWTFCPYCKSQWGPKRHWTPTDFYRMNRFFKILLFCSFCILQGKKHACINFEDAMMPIFILAWTILLNELCSGL